MAALGLLDSFLFQRSSCTPRLHALFSCDRGAEEGLDRVFYGLMLSKSERGRRVASKTRRDHVPWRSASQR